MMPTTKGRWEFFCFTLGSSLLNIFMYSRWLTLRVCYLLISLFWCATSIKVVSSVHKVERHVAPPGWNHFYINLMNSASWQGALFFLWQTALYNWNVNSFAVKEILAHAVIMIHWDHEEQPYCTSDFDYLGFFFSSHFHLWPTDNWTLTGQNWRFSTMNKP